VRELDAGPVYGVLTEPIGPADTAGDLLDRLAVAGAELLVATLDGIESGQLESRPQPTEGVSLAPKISSSDAQVRWDMPALGVDRLVRACTPSPGAWTVLDGGRVKLGPVVVATAEVGIAAARLEPGVLRLARDKVLVGTGTAAVELGDVQPDGKRRMSAVEWARGLRLHDGAAVLG
jgi:methionyl-tRNA formyltransferase